MKIEMSNSIYKIHPIYDLYAADENGNVINIVKKVPMKGNENISGYMYVNVRKHGEKNCKNYLVTDSSGNASMVLFLMEKSSIISTISEMIIDCVIYNC